MNGNLRTTALWISVTMAIASPIGTVLVLQSNQAHIKEDIAEIKGKVNGMSKEIREAVKDHVSFTHKAEKELTNHLLENHNHKELADGLREHMASQHSSN